jgi:hypothetical protein
MKKYKLPAIIACLCLLFATCTDNYDDYNKSTTGSTEEEMSRDDYLQRQYLLTMQNWVIPVDVNTNQFVECLLGGSFGGYFADSNEGFNNRNYSTYTPEEHWIQVAFNDVIPRIMTNHKFLYNSTDNPVSLGVADILKVMALSRITDIYGPIPYSQVGTDGALNAPYDSQEQVYTRMLQELDAAIAALTQRRTDDFSSKSDRVYGGVVVSWIKLANSLKLRLAMRIADVKPELARAKAEEAANHEVGTLASNGDNAFLTLTNTNPFRVIMYEYNEGDSRVSADITTVMNGYKDPRREKYFTQSTLTGTGIVNGYFGLRSGIMIPSTPQIKLYSNMRVEAASKLLWMNAAETAFLKAEGGLRGWNMGASAEESYNRGIALSFEQWGASGADAYAQNSTNKPEGYKDPLSAFTYYGTISDATIKWTASDSFEKNLERIITQKWIANFPLGIEAWSEFRRTGYPVLMRVDRNNSGGTVSTERMARRLPYPQEEYTENAENVATAVSQYLKGPDNMGTDVWWAKKN